VDRRMSAAWTTPLFAEPMADALSSGLALLAVVFASAGSIGGGGLLVPLFVLVSSLGRFAIPLSKATIMGGAIANAFMRWHARHPTSDRPLIAFDVAVMFEPATLIGTFVGVTLNTLCPTWLITMSLIALLSFTAKKTLVKAFATWAKENATSLDNAKKTAPPILRQLSGSARLSTREVNNALTISAADAFEVGGTETPASESLRASLLTKLERNSSTALDAIIERERTPPVKFIVLLIISWLFMFTSVLLRGGHGAPPLLFSVPCGGFLYWLIPSVTSLGLIGITHVAGRLLASQHAAKVAAQFEFGEGDPRWEGNNLTVLPMLCTLAGIAAGGLGVGGASECRVSCPSCA